MSRALRWSETWFRRGLWLLSLIFASFLIGLGGLIVGDLPQTHPAPAFDSLLAQPEAAQLQQRLKSVEREITDLEESLARDRLLLEAARNQTAAARDNLSAWLQTRQTTATATRDPDLLVRTRDLEVLKRSERDWEQRVEQQQQGVLAISQRRSQDQRRLQVLQEQAQTRWQASQRRNELQVFLLRLAVTLPLLVVAGWLYLRRRHSAYWPFVWGFIFFAGFAFFVELVPYLPSYGGYVRYGVGLLLTAVLGHYAIRAMRRYLEQQQAQEALPDAQRRQQLDYELTHTRLAKGLCPGCERAIPLQDPQRNFCMHCGLKVFMPCTRCGVRMPALARFCPGCGCVPSADGATA